MTQTQVVRPVAWLQPGPIRLNAAHSEQVTALPPGAVTPETAERLRLAIAYWWAFSARYLPSWCVRLRRFSRLIVETDLSGAVLDGAEHDLSLMTLTALAVGGRVHEGEARTAAVSKNGGFVTTISAPARSASAMPQPPR